MENNICCKDMEYFLNYRCSIRSDRYKCPDCTFDFNAENNIYGIIVHGEGQSYIQINFCPWCGKKL